MMALWPTFGQRIFGRLVYVRVAADAVAECGYHRLAYYEPGFCVKRFTGIESKEWKNEKEMKKNRKKRMGES